MEEIDSIRRLIIYKDYQAKLSRDELFGNPFYQFHIDDELTLNK